MSETMRLGNEAMELELDAARGTLCGLNNRLTGERFAVSGDGWAVELLGAAGAGETQTITDGDTDVTRQPPRRTDTGVVFGFAHPQFTAELHYDLRPGRHFAERRLDLTFTRDVGLRHLTVGTPAFAADGLTLVCYRHPDFEWLIAYVKARHNWPLTRPPDSEPSRTFFGRTARGGFFAGVAMPYDDSALAGATVRLGYAPSLRVAAGERLAGEPVYLGVYRRRERDTRAADWRPSNAGGGPAPTLPVYPLPSESAAMVALTGALLGPPRHGVKAYACGWHCQMTQHEYTDESLAGDLGSLEVFRACGLDGTSDSHPWGGETAAMAALRAGDRYVPGPRVQRFLARARELGLDVTQWPTMNNTHPWNPAGGPLRADRPDWLRGVAGEPLGGANADNFRRRLSNCFACGPYTQWLERLILDDALGPGAYASWCMDGDFWGTGAYLHTILPVTCTAANHDHLPGDANYACQRRLAGLIAAVRRRQPGVYIIMCRPPMDLGVWANRDVDACFTLIESGTGGSNVAGGDEIRTASRLRVHHQFFPHWLDQSLLFPSYASASHVPPWPSEHLAYIMLSALSCSPNLLLYLPTKTGLPAADQADIKRWLDWGRANVEYLLVRHDLVDWPGPGRVDGSAHLRGDRGLIFLFNPDAEERRAEFVLSPDDTGFTGTAPVTIRQEFPALAWQCTSAPGTRVIWPLPPQSAAVLRVAPVV